MSTPSTFNDIIQGDKPVLVDFFATWCGPCQMMPPILKEVKTQLGESASILKVDVDKNPDLAGQLHISGVPTLIVFKQGKIVWRQSGVVPAHQLVQILKSHV